MKRIILGCLIILFVSTLNAREVKKGSTLMAKKDSTTAIIPSNKSALPKDTIVNKTFLSRVNKRQSEMVDSIKMLQRQLLEKNNEIEQYKLNNKALEAQIGREDTCIVNLSTNYLFIPYEDYSVENSAVPAIDNVYNKTLLEKQSVRINLLKNYKQHVQQFRDFLIRMNVECKKKFRDINKDFITPFTSQPFFIEYKKFDKHESMYLWKFYVEVLKRFKSYTNENNPKFDDIIKELTDKLNTGK
jgi:hypothetical protein